VRLVYGCAVGCAAAPSIETLVIWRFVQGAGSAAGSVIVFAVIRDLFIDGEFCRWFFGWFKKRKAIRAAKRHIDKADALLKKLKQVK
jgi:MFS family permease